jgi:hypothetical protein
MTGYSLVRRGYGVLGLAILWVYAALGLGGMDHYGLAPISAHTFAMNLSIWLEVLTVSIVLIVVSGIIANRLCGKEK